MAAPSRTAQVNDIGLESVRLMLGDLSEVAAEWDTMAPAEHASWSLDWDQAMGSDLVVLRREYEAGDMTPRQQARYRELLARLKQALPTIERLNLYRPPVPLDADAMPPVRGRPPEADRAR